MTIKGSIISRRRALTGAATAGIGMPLLAACGDDGSDGASDATDPTTSASSSSTASGKPTKANQADTSSAPAGDGIPTAQVPVGGGLVVSDDQIVITQPTEGDFKAFTAVCTHAQCLVADVSGGTINCPCHGSQYSIADGSVVGGPAPSPLSAVNITVTGDQIEIA